MYKEIQKQSISIKLFATLRKTMNSDSLLLDIDETITASQLKELVLENYPLLKKSKIPFFVSVNCEFAKDFTPVKPTDEVALLPPVSGG